MSGFIALQGAFSRSGFRVLGPFPGCGLQVPYLPRISLPQSATCETLPEYLGCDFANRPAVRPYCLQHVVGHAPAGTAVRVVGVTPAGKPVTFYFGVSPLPEPVPTAASPTFEPTRGRICVESNSHSAQVLRQTAPESIFRGTFVAGKHSPQKPRS
jgi:hypothetical protein